MRKGLFADLSPVWSGAVTPALCYSKCHGLQGSREVASNHAETCSAVAFKKFHFYGLLEPARLHLEFQLKG